jgi:hypothetical protein
MKKITAVALTSIFILSLFAAGSTAASAAGPSQNVIIVFKSPVTQEDVKYIEGLGGVIKYTYTIIDGIAASLPQAALNRLRSLQGSPCSDPVAGRIKYIENDGTMYALGDGTAPASQDSVAVQALPADGPVSPAVAEKPVAGPTVEAAGALLQNTVMRLVTSDMHVFPILPLTAAGSGA